MQDFVRKILHLDIFINDLSGRPPLHSTNKSLKTAGVESKHSVGPLDEPYSKL